MLFNKKLGVLVLATTLATGTIVTAEQIQTDSEEIQITTEDMQNTEVYSEELGEEVIATEVGEVYSEDIDEYLSSTPLNNYPLNDPSEVLYFVINEDFPYMKIYVDNKGNDEISVAIHKGSPTGPIVNGTQIKIPAHSSYSYKVPTAQSTDTYWVTAQGKNNYPMNGTLSIRIADTYRK